MWDSVPEPLLQALNVAFTSEHLSLFMVICLVVNLASAGLLHMLYMKLQRK
jgi:hypothetical protein